MGLKELLETVIAGGLGGTLVYAILNKIAWYADLESEYKRYIAIGLNMVVAVLAYLAAIGMGYYPTPLGTKAWIESIAGVILSIGSTMFVASQIVQVRDFKK